MRTRRKHQPIQPPQFRHPSGRPIDRIRHGITSRYNAPVDEPLTPSLRTKELPEAMGFIHDFSYMYNDDDDDFDYTRESE